MKHFYKDVPGFMSDSNLKCFNYVLEKNKDKEITWVELGSYSGKSAAYCVVELLKRSHGFNFTCIDLWENGMLESFEKNTLPIQEYINYSKNFSHVAAKKFKKGTVDVCYVDADHSYEAVTKDLEAWWPKLKSGADFIGDDYTKGFPGVQKAVHDFFMPRGIRVKKMGRCWYVEKP